MTLPDVVTTLDGVVKALKRLGVRYRVGGSVASSVYGVPRTTTDVDIVCDLSAEHSRPLAELLSGTYYADADMIAEAVAMRRSFNVIHLETMMKVDVFVLKERPYDRQAFARVRQESMVAGEGAALYDFSSPEDIVLSKLVWFRLGGETSERQWNDVLNVLKVQAGAMETAYLRKWAAELAISDLLKRVMEEAEAE